MSTGITDPIAEEIKQRQQARRATPNELAAAHQKELDRLAQPALDAGGEWRDVGGHAWERRKNVECVECPHCCFTFAAVHTDGNSAGYSCPNCEGCPDAALATTQIQEK